MPDKSDYLQFTLENILNQISEVKELISDSSKSNLVFRDEMIARITALELRVNTIETEKNLVKGGSPVIGTTGIVCQSSTWISNGTNWIQIG